MSTTTKRTAELAAVVEQVPGVDEVYPATPVLTAVVNHVVGALTQKPRDPEFVALTETDEGVTASVSIGVADAGAATEVCRKVYDTIEEYFVESGDPAVTAIEVKVARIG